MTHGTLPFSDNKIDEDEQWYDAQSDLYNNESLFHQFRNYRHRAVCHADIVDTQLENRIIPMETLRYEVQERVVKPQEPNYG
jgi:hypothetical protein